MVKLLGKYKKQCVILGIILFAILFIVYLRALFQTGFWHGDAFLYKMENGSYQGSDIYAEYKMTVNSAEYGANIDFYVNDKLNHYMVKYSGNDLQKDVEIKENNKTIFDGTAFCMDNNWILHQENIDLPGDIKVYTSNYVPAEEELFPGYTNLYNWAVAKRADIRGNAYMLFFIFLLAAFLFLDIKFPKLFWILEHRLDVYGGEPSDWYLFGQKIGRVIMALGIPVCMVLTFTIH